MELDSRLVGLDFKFDVGLFIPLALDLKYLFLPCDFGLFGLELQLFCKAVTHTHLQSDDYNPRCLHRRSRHARNTSDT